MSPMMRPQRSALTRRRVVRSHQLPEAGEFDSRRQLGELRSVVDSEAGRTYLAEAYTGWPLG
ncbi:hypothetical protein KEC56_01950 [Microbacterium sp. YMB-B2]|uniref:Uncharacterized protein n=1 Tax=Microbacterium tenebrionis TaxID=2830665 RepID=A0A9X1RY76_9MICO|nr:hypothetical protein [Microbacterium tenebrionis]MCC2028301.1 hypothetical protein [Microbacterium tenebrionis]